MILHNIIPDWTAPKHVVAFTTTRVGGVSLPPFHGNNMGMHVGDYRPDVQYNRAQLMRLHQLTKEPAWLEQTHSSRCIVVEQVSDRIADAAITRCAQQPLVIMTADCLPILLCNLQGDEVAAIHAGWRGLVNGVIENTLTQMDSPANSLLAWIGPAICQACFEVGKEVYEAYLARYPQTHQAFRIHGDKYLANLPKMAEWVLKSAGVCQVYQSGICTYEQKNRLYSYRREPNTGRMASLIWFHHQTG